jgi:RNA polymerase sigma-70 factor (sigma-E family)
LDGPAREAFRGYVTTRSPALLRTAYLLTGDRTDAEDLLQEALARLAVSWHRVREHEALDGYVRRTMINLRTSRWRVRRVETVSMAEPPGATVGGDLADPLADHDAMWRALQRLPMRMRAVLVLRFYEDLSEAEAADVLACSVGTVKSQTSRALAKLRQDTALKEGAPC